MSRRCTASARSANGTANGKGGSRSARDSSGTWCISWTSSKPRPPSESPKWLSDGGKGVEDIIAACDGETDETRHMRCIKIAREKLRRAHPELVEVFNLIVKNGSNRKESIWQLMSRSRANGR